MDKDKLFTENEIRPDNLKDGQKQCFKNDIRRLLKYRDNFTSVVCPACNSNENKMLFTKYGMKFVICKICSTGFINPRPTKNILEYYYRNSENYSYWNKYIFPASENVRREKIFKPRVETILNICNRYKVPKDTLLEVGAGYGIFCEEMDKKKVFKNVVAIEPTPDLAATCRKKGLKVIEKPVEKVKIFRNKISVIVSFEVIEHLFNPKEFILKCAKLLSKDGLLVITCPNIKGFDMTVLGKESDSYDVEHLNYFNPDSITKLLIKCGFEVMEIMTPGKLDAELVRKKALEKVIDLRQQPFLKRLLIDEWETRKDK